MRPLVTSAAAVTVLLLLAACTPEGGGRPARPDQAQRAEPSATVRSYAALGDSFTAGPLIPSTDLAGGCFRSDRNYPALVADRLRVEQFVDVSCTGATTQHVSRRQETVADAAVPPQLRALHRDTDLVTLGIGGNDLGLFQDVIATCSGVYAADQGGRPCATALSERGVDLLARTQRTSDRVATSIRQVRRRAPRATVLLVGYPRLVPRSRRCAALPFAPGDYRHAARVGKALDDALRRAARRTGVGFVDVYAASAGHDICSDGPWVNGHLTVEGEALAFHPLAAGMEAVAKEVVAAVLAGRDGDRP